MAETRETLKLVGQIRIRVSETVDSTTDDLVRAWAHAWTLVVDDWQDAVEELQREAGDSRWPSRSKVLKAERAQRALEATYQGLLDLDEHAGVVITSAVNPVVEAASGYGDVVKSQMPPPFRTSGGGLVRADTDQIRAIVIRAQENVSKYLFGGPLESFDRIRETLVRGVAQGQNPRKAAAQLVRKIEIGHSLALNRALVVTRTELLDAHRAAALAQRQANSDLLTGWRWTAALDARTCPACLGMDGTIHGVDEAGPLGHQQCRCVAVPVTKSWKDLGFDKVEEPPSMAPDAGEWFARQPKATQVKMLGPARHEAWSRGDYPMSQWAERRTNIGWRDSFVTSPAPGRP